MSFGLLAFVLAALAYVNVQEKLTWQYIFALANLFLVWFAFYDTWPKINFGSF